MSNWNPDQDFIKFLETDSGGELGISMGGTSVVNEIKQGTELGREMYQRLLKNKAVQKRYQKWKNKK